MTITKDGWTLVHDISGAPAQIGDVVPDFRGDMHKIKGGNPPHKPSSTGRVYTDRGEFFPGVCDLKWVKSEPVTFESISEHERAKALHEAIRLIGQEIGDEAIIVLNLYLIEARHRPELARDRHVVDLARSILDWEQDFYNEQYKGNGRIGG